MRIELLREELLFDTVHVTFQLTFDNRAFTLASLAMTREEKHLPISASVLFEIFPFCIVFGYVSLILILIHNVFYYKSICFHYFFLIIEL